MRVPAIASDSDVLAKRAGSEGVPDMSGEAKRAWQGGATFAMGRGPGRTKNKSEGRPGLQSAQPNG